MENQTFRCVIAASVLLFCGSVDAQAQEPSPAPLVRAFIGGGLGPGTDDSGSRMRLATEGSSMHWFIEGGARLLPRVGVGAEFVQTAVLTAATSGRSFNESGTQRERMLVGLLRARAGGTDRVALDLVGGAGVLFQHHERRFAPCFTGCADSLRDSRDGHAPAFVLGADVPFQVGRHLGLSVVTRCYALRRAERIADTATLLPWQYETRPSTRLTIGVSARATW
jgi:hypothetical protein